MTAAEIDTAVEDQKVAAALVIPKGFGAAARRLGSRVALPAHPHRDLHRRPVGRRRRCRPPSPS